MPARVCFGFVLLSIALLFQYDCVCMVPISSQGSHIISEAIAQDEVPKVSSLTHLSDKEEVSSRNAVNGGEDLRNINDATNSATPVMPGVGETSSVEGSKRARTDSHKLKAGLDPMARPFIPASGVHPDMRRANLPRKEVKNAPVSRKLPYDNVAAPVFAVQAYMHDPNVYYAFVPQLIHSSAYDDNGARFSEVATMADNLPMGYQLMNVQNYHPENLSKAPLPVGYEFMTFEKDHIGFDPNDVPRGYQITATAQTVPYFLPQPVIATEKRHPAGGELLPMQGTLLAYHLIPNSEPTVSRQQSVPSRHFKQTKFSRKSGKFTQKIDHQSINISPKELKAELGKGKGDNVCELSQKNNPGSSNAQPEPGSTSSSSSDSSLRGHTVSYPQTFTNDKKLKHCRSKSLGDYPSGFSTLNMQLTHNEKVYFPWKTGVSSSQEVKGSILKENQASSPGISERGHIDLPKEKSKSSDVNGVLEDEKVEIEPQSRTKVITKAVKEDSEDYNEVILKKGAFDAAGDNNIVIENEKKNSVSYAEKLMGISTTQLKPALESGQELKETLKETHQKQIIKQTKYEKSLENEPDSKLTDEVEDPWHTVKYKKKKKLFGILGEEGKIDPRPDVSSQVRKTFFPKEKSIPIIPKERKISKELQKESLDQKKSNPKEKPFKEKIIKNVGHGKDNIMNPLYGEDESQILGIHESEKSLKSKNQNTSISIPETNEDLIQFPRNTKINEYETSQKEKDKHTSIVESSPIENDSYKGLNLNQLNEMNDEKLKSREMNHIKQKTEPQGPLKMSLKAKKKDNKKESIKHDLETNLKSEMIQNFTEVTEGSPKRITKKDYTLMDEHFETAFEPWEAGRSLGIIFPGIRRVSILKNEVDQDSKQGKDMDNNLSIWGSNIVLDWKEKKLDFEVMNILANHIKFHDKSDHLPIESMGKKLFNKLRKLWFTEKSRILKAHAWFQANMQGYEGTRRALTVSKQILEHTMVENWEVIKKYLLSIKKVKQIDVNFLEGIFQLSTPFSYMSNLETSATLLMMKYVQFGNTGQTHLDVLEKLIGHEAFLIKTAILQVPEPIEFARKNFPPAALHPCIEAEVLGVNIDTALEIADCLQLESKDFFENSSGIDMVHYGISVLMKHMPYRGDKCIPWHESPERKWLVKRYGSLYDLRINQLSRSAKRKEKSYLKTVNKDMVNEVYKHLVNAFLETKMVSICNLGNLFKWLDAGISPHSISLILKKKKEMSIKSVTQIDLLFEGFDEYLTENQIYKIKNILMETFK